MSLALSSNVLSLSDAAAERVRGLLKRRAVACHGPARQRRKRRMRRHVL